MGVGPDSDSATTKEVVNSPLSLATFSTLFTEDEELESNRVDPNRKGSSRSEERKWIMNIALLRSRLALVLIVLALLALLVASLTVLPALHHTALHWLAVGPDVIVHNH